MDCAIADSYRYALNQHALPETPVLSSMAERYGFHVEDVPAPEPKRKARWTNGKGRACRIEIEFLRASGDCLITLVAYGLQDGPKSVGWRFALDVLPLASQPERWTEVLEEARLLGEECNAPQQADGRLDTAYLIRQLDNRRLRRKAVFILLCQRDERSIPALLSLLDDELIDVRRMAAAALSRLVGQERNDLFAPLLHDPSPAVRYIARKAINAEFPYRPREPA